MHTIDMRTQQNGLSSTPAPDNEGCAWFTPAPEPVDWERRSDCPDKRPTWWLRHDMNLTELVTGAIQIHVTCLGYYELFVNGTQVDVEPLAPSLTTLDRRVAVITHTVNELVRPGSNQVAIWCSSGWYLPHQFTVHQGWTPVLRVTATFPDSAGTPVSLLDDSGHWRCRPSHRSIIGGWHWNNFGGEEVDARLEEKDWATGDCGGWRRVRVLDEAPPITCTPRSWPGNRLGPVFPAQSVRHLAEKSYEIDFGRCLSGWLDLTFPSLRRGQQIELRTFDLPSDRETARDQSYGQRSVYIAHGDVDRPEQFRNQFNYAGFRYLVIEGLDVKPDLGRFQAIQVESDLAESGRFHCSQDILNRVYQLDRWTLRCLNLGAYHVDCPHRERYGYGADGISALPGYVTHFDSIPFLSKWLDDWLTIWEPANGRVGHCAPTRHHAESPAWGGIVFHLSWLLWIETGDRDQLERCYPMLRSSIDRLQAGVRNGVLRHDAYNWKFHGDWVPPERGMDSADKPTIAMKELFNTAYLGLLWKLFSYISRVLGHTDVAGEAKRHRSDLQAGLRREFYSRSHDCYLLPEQTYQVLPLIADLVPPDDKEHVYQRLLQLLDQRDGLLDTGLLGTYFLLDLLGKSGEHNRLVQLLGETRYPSWGYMLEHGATTIWEQWNGFWSQIHSCFTGPSGHLVAYIAGITLDRTPDGKLTVRLRPAIDAGIDRLAVERPTIAGVISSSWNRDPDTNIWKWTFTIPTNTTAIAYLPNSCEDILMNGTQADFMLQNDEYQIIIGSGVYALSCRCRSNS